MEAGGGMWLCIFVESRLGAIQKQLAGGYPEFVLIFQGLFQLLQQSESQQI